MLLVAWKKELKTRKIPYSLNLNLIDMLTDAATVCSCVHIRTCIHMYICTYVHMYICTYVHTYVCNVLIKVGTHDRGSLDKSHYPDPVLLLACAFCSDW